MITVLFAENALKITLMSNTTQWCVQKNVCENQKGFGEVNDYFAE